MFLSFASKRTPAMTDSPTMKAALCHSYGPPEVLTVAQVPRPRPKTDEMLVRVMASAVNSADVRVRGLEVEGLMKLVMRIVLGFTGPRRPILGTVLSGIVEEVGPKVTAFKPGDEVYAMTGMAFGAHAEYTTLKENGTVALKPKNATHEEAAAIVFGGSTALHFLQKAGVAEGMRVLVYGAAGAVGTSAIQVAKYHGARVTAVCSRDGMELARSLGADHVIDRNAEDADTSGHTFDIILDAVGRTKRKDFSRCLAKGGKYLTVGGMEVASETREQLHLLSRMFDEGKLRAAIDRTYALDDIIEAHRYVDSGRKKGNLVIHMNG